VTTLKIYDGNAHARRQLEADPSGLAIRNLVTDVASDPCASVFVWDGPGGNEKRRKLYPEYKAGRKPAGEDIWAGINLCRELLGHTKAIQITVPGYEGDDVVATLCRMYAPKVDTIRVISTDRDLCALCVLPGVVHSEGSLKNIPPEQVRLYKATKGDPSDSIPGIKGFGDVAWQNCNKDALQAWYRSDESLANLGVEEVSETFDIPKGCASWLIDHEPQARVYYTIVGFIDVPEDELHRGTTVGRPDPAAVAAALKQWML